MEALRANKKLIIIPNQDLLDNHQLELTTKFGNKGYCLVSSIENLKDTIGLSDTFVPNPLPQPDKNMLKVIFQSVIDRI